MLSSPSGGGAAARSGATLSKQRSVSRASHSPGAATVRPNERVRSGLLLANSCFPPNRAVKAAHASFTNALKRKRSISSVSSAAKTHAPAKMRVDNSRTATGAHQDGVKPISIALSQGVNIAPRNLASQLNATLLTNQVRSAQAQAINVQPQLSSSSASSAAPNVSIVVSSAEQLNSLMGSHVINLHNLTNVPPAQQQQQQQPLSQQQNPVIRSSKLQLNKLNHLHDAAVFHQPNTPRSTSLDDVSMLNFNDRSDAGLARLRPLNQQQTVASGSVAAPIVIPDSPAKPQLKPNLNSVNHMMTLTSRSPGSHALARSNDGSHFTTASPANTSLIKRPIAAGSSLLLNNLTKVRKVL